MIDVGEILNWLKYRKLRRQRQQDYAAHQRLFEKTITVHGRIELGHLVKNEDGLPPEIRMMYHSLLKEAPVDQWSVWN